MTDTSLPDLSRRERQIMDVVYRLSRATATEVLENLPDPPSYSAVRALLAKLEQKGHVRHAEEGRAYIYAPIVRKDLARRGALAHLLRTFFDNSTEQAVAALLELKGEKLSEPELDRVAEMIERARREGR